MASDGRWFRYYDDAVHNPKVQRLPGNLFKSWVNVLCLASKNGGMIPTAADVAFGLRIAEDKAAALIAELAQRELLDDVGGGRYVPHEWDEKQHTGATSSAERVKRHRERKRNATLAVTAPVTGNVTVTPAEQSRADTEQSTADARVTDGRVTQLRVGIVKAFEGIGRMPPDTARAEVWVAQGYDPPIVLAVIREHLSRKPKISTLNYFDAPIAEAHAARRAPTPAAVPDDPQVLRAKQARFVRLWLENPPHARRGAWLSGWDAFCGGMPGTDRCTIPPDVLAEAGWKPEEQAA